VTEKEKDFRNVPYYGRGRRESQSPMSATIHHLGWAVRSIEQSRSYFETALGLDFRGEETFPDLRVAFFGGPVAVELLEPLDAATDVGKFLAKHGEGIHHLALRVDDVADALEAASRNGLVLIDTAPQSGARGTMVGVVDPARPDGVLIQYVQEP
jgi:methylmalonyl-CoA/ethylmalonyl-CoA epimerase